MRASDVSPNVAKPAQVTRRKSPAESTNALATTRRKAAKPFRDPPGVLAPVCSSPGSGREMGSESSEPSRPAR
eukprot:CAMPEP_0183370000 /NCGR_PEP_ID=MMETSP0164_2-20130417/101186_1 /TAXON_ID=221442 /ORGANISM="Coccolithus pelagicus ssp braarudi, Strain PLY182g" /LENGTH=72 /DNA_ID=CAMNT_0025546321 /DNA_START=53 /DNA_END=268 /DNA_ORIENTATION=-